MIIIQRLSKKAKISIAMYFAGMILSVIYSPWDNSGGSNSNTLFEILFYGVTDIIEFIKDVSDFSYSYESLSPVIFVCFILTVFRIMNVIFDKIILNDEIDVIFLLSDYASFCSEQLDQLKTNFFEYFPLNMWDAAINHINDGLTEFLTSSLQENFFSYLTCLFCKIFIPKIYNTNIVNSNIFKIIAIFSVISYCVYIILYVLFGIISLNIINFMINQNAFLEITGVIASIIKYLTTFGVVTIEVIICLFLLNIILDINDLLVITFPYRIVKFIVNLAEAVFEVLTKVFEFVIEYLEIFIFIFIFIFISFIISSIIIQYDYWYDSSGISLYDVYSYHFGRCRLIFTQIKEGYAFIGHWLWTSFTEEILPLIEELISTTLEGAVDSIT